MKPPDWSTLWVHLKERFVVSVKEVQKWNSMGGHRVEGEVKRARRLVLRALLL